MRIVTIPSIVPKIIVMGWDEYFSYPLRLLPASGYCYTDRHAVVLWVCLSVCPSQNWSDIFQVKIKMFQF